MAAPMRTKIPSRQECLKLMEEYGMLENIATHSLSVARVALFLAKELNKRGQQVNVDLVRAASLLHDLAKTECLRTKEDHARSGYLLLKRMGYERIGEIVAQHIWISKKGDPQRVSEEEIVNYADKRIQHDRLVSLKERFIDLRNRYGTGPDAIGYLETLEIGSLEIERKIFSILDMDPGDLERLQGHPVMKEECV